MATIKQVGPGRRTVGTIDGITYVTRKGKTFARAIPIMPARVFNTPAALRRRAIFRMVQMHLKYHRRTIKKTFTPRSNGSPANRYYSENAKLLTLALTALAERWVAGDIVTLSDVETAICAFAMEHPQAIKIAMMDEYDVVYLTGEWPSTITLQATAGSDTIIIIVAESGQTTTINPDGSTTVTGGSGSGTNTGGGSSSGSEPSTVTAPVISGTTPFTESTQASITCSTAGASIYYTIDGSTPTSSSTAYSEALTLTVTTTVKAIAIKDGVSSSVTTKTFTKSTGGAGSE